MSRGNTTTTLTPCKPLTHRLSWAANNPDIREDGLRDLREIRLRRGLSQADLSTMTGVAEFTISEIESGKRANPRPSTLRKLAQGLGVEVADLYGEPDSPLGQAPPEEERRPKTVTGEAHLSGTGKLTATAKIMQAADDYKAGKISHEEFGEVVRRELIPA